MKQHSIGTSRATGTGISQLPFLDKTGLTEQWAARPYIRGRAAGISPENPSQFAKVRIRNTRSFENPRPRNWPSQRYRDVVFEMRCRVCGVTGVWVSRVRSGVQERGARPARLPNHCLGVSRGPRGAGTS